MRRHCLAVGKSKNPGLQSLRPVSGAAVGVLTGVNMMWRCGTWSGAEMGALGSQAVSGTPLEVGHGSEKSTSRPLHSFLPTTFILAFSPTMTIEFRIYFFLSQVGKQTQRG